MSASLPPAEVLRHVIDVHCHPTDSEIPEADMEELSIRICAMASRQSDQELVAKLARALPEKVIPCFGYHPWFSHWISLAVPPPPKDVHYRALLLEFGQNQSTNQEALGRDRLEAFERLLPSLPEPVSLRDVLTDLRQNFTEFPEAMLGEIGLDRSARISFDYNAEQRELSPFNIPFEHQMSIVEAQIGLAVELKRNISFHSVKSQKLTVDLLDRMNKVHGEAWPRISIDLHSCGLSPETWKDIEKLHKNAFLSLSTVVNARSPAHRRLIEKASPGRLLVESDIHEIGQCALRTWEMVQTIADVKGWKVEDRWEDDVEEEDWGTVRRLQRNWEVFRRGA